MRAPAAMCPGDCEPVLHRSVRPSGGRGSGGVLLAGADHRHLLAIPPMVSLIATWFARSALGQAVTGALAILVAVALYLRHRDRQTERRSGDAAELQQLRGSVATRARMDNADTGYGDPDDDRQWLLERGQRARREPPLVRGH